MFTLLKLRNILNNWIKSLRIVRLSALNLLSSVKRSSQGLVRSRGVMLVAFLCALCSLSVSFLYYGELSTLFKMRFDKRIKQSELLSNVLPIYPTNSCAVLMISEQRLLDARSEVIITLSLSLFADLDKLGVFHWVTYKTITTTYLNRNQLVVSFCLLL